MIDKQEIENKAKEFGIHTSNLQRDYVFGWLLAGIYGESMLSETFLFKGGNCLRKAYFEHARFSNDLDFSIVDRIDQNIIMTELNRVCKFVEDRAGISFNVDMNRIDEKFALDKERSVYQARLYFKDFYGNPNRIIIHVRLDITELEKICLPIQDRYLIHPYSDSDDINVVAKCVKLEEMLGAKLKCMLQRRQTQDLYDFVYSFLVNKAIEINRLEVVSAFLKKTIFEASPGVAKGLLLDVPLEIMRKIWRKYIICPATSFISFEQALSGFKSTIELLFSEFPSFVSHHASFFPSHLRNPIIEAGADLKLIHLTYSNVKREVEPYSLVFKRRKDGFGQEYFYGYDRTGGMSSGPSIKSFVHKNIQKIEILDKTFEPRFPVELSRAGEFASRTYFSRPFPATRKSRRSRSLGYIEYVIECPYCDRQFKRSKYSTRLNRHKDKYGNDCYGRIGYLIDQR